MNSTRAIRAITAACLVFLLAGCWALRTSRPTDNASLQSGLPIRDASQAVNTAQAFLSNTRLQAKQTPRLVSVQKLRMADVNRRIPETALPADENRSPDTPVWLVIFSGEWQVVPPDPSHTVAPVPVSQECVYVLTDANDAGRSQVGAIECSR